MHVSRMNFYTRFVNRPLINRSGLNGGKVTSSCVRILRNGSKMSGLSARLTRVMVLIGMIRKFGEISMLIGKFFVRVELEKNRVVIP